MTVLEAIEALEAILRTEGDVPVCFVEAAGREYYTYKFPSAVASMEIGEKKQTICAFLTSELLKGLDTEENSYGNTLN